MELLPVAKIQHCESTLLVMTDETEPSTPAVSAEIEELYFADGQVLAMPPGSVTMIVGPNNAGKTVLLSEIASRVSWTAMYGHMPPQLRTLTKVSLRKAGTFEQFIDWLGKNGVRYRDPSDPGNPRQYYAANAQSDENSLQQAWNDPSGLGQAAAFVLSHQTTDSRLQLAAGTPVHNVEAEAPRHPLHYLWQDSQKEADFNTLIRRAFGFEVCINRYSQQVDLKVGRPELPDTAPPPSEELLRQYSALKSIAEQGDGVRSFAGLLLQVLVPRYRLTLIDEPEAFLHPPQARLLAKYLAELSPIENQLVIATHSQDILQGVLDADSSRPVQIVRLTRSVDGPAKARFLSPELVAEISRDSFLQHSNTLSGLFHDCVVICEADADCQYYRIAMDWQYRDVRTPDILFSQVAGKARIASVAHKLGSLGVPRACVVDFDVLNEQSTFRRLVEEFGGAWSEVQEDYAQLSSSVEDPSGPTVRSVRDAVVRATANLADGGRLDETRVKVVSDSLKATSGWRQLKRTGLSGVMQGEAQAAAQRLLARLRNIGIFIVPVGELERWHPQFSGKSNEWLARVLEEDAYKVESTERKSFIRDLADFVAREAGRDLQPLEPIANLAGQRPKPARQ